MTDREPSRPSMLEELADLRRRVHTLELMERGYAWDPTTGTVTLPSGLVVPGSVDVASLTATGAATVPTPTLPGHAATAAYVDDGDDDVTAYVDAGHGYWASRPSGDQSITSSSSWQKVSWGTPSGVSSDAWGSGVDLTAPVTGIYAVAFMWVMTGGSASRAIHAIAVTSATNPSSGETIARHDGTAEGNHWRTIAAIIHMPAGTPLNGYVWVNASSRTINSATRLSILRIR